jgi:hypothetical protein
VRAAAKLASPLHPRSRRSSRNLRASLPISWPRPAPALPRRSPARAPPS